MKKIIIASIIFLIFIGYFYLNTRAKIDSNIRHINSLLYNLNVEIDLLEYTKKNYNMDKYIEQRLTFLITSKMLIIAKYSPPIEKLRGTPLKALNRLIVYNKTNPINFSLGSSEELYSDINTYIEKVEEEVKKEIRIRDEILGDPLKKEFKKKWKME